MPWKETSPVDQRTLFIADWRSGVAAISDLCRRFGISRKTGYKWLARYQEAGAGGLAEQSRRPRHSPSAIAPPLVEAVLAARNRHPTWGPKKLLVVLRRRQPHAPWPAPSTVARLLHRHGLAQPRRRRPPLSHPGRPGTLMTAPNRIWTADFKGHFRTGDGPYCYPLTIVDGYSRFLLACQALADTSQRAARPVFERLFHEYGLPDIIRTDNGVPFASCAARRLSKLSVWWIRLGIWPELIEPGAPQQNGRHERFHRTLKAETARPPAGSRAAQQRRFNAFRQQYNAERPHEALRQRTPDQLYHPSLRPYPRPLPPLEYPKHFEVRYVSRNGGIRWRSRWVNISHVLDQQHVGFEEVADGSWDVYFGPLWLGRFTERTGRVDFLDPHHQLLPMS
jgi:putative transposase